MPIKLSKSCFVSFFYLYWEYNSFLITFMTLSELFLALNWAKEISNLLSILFSFSISNPSPCCCLLNSRMFSTRLTMSFGFSGFFSCSLLFSISTFMSLNPLSIKFTWISFFWRLYFDLRNFPSNAARSWTWKCFLTNSLFMSQYFRSSSLWSLIWSRRPFSFLIFLSSSSYLAFSSSFSSQLIGNILFLNP